MSHQFNPEQKANALNMLARNGGDVAQTSPAETGIPHRTLYRWRGELWEHWRQQTPPPPLPQPLPEFEDVSDALGYLRHKIMRELLNIANNFPEGLAYTTSAQRVSQLSQLLERLMELDEHLKPYRPVKQEVGRLLFGWDAGLYLRTDKGYRGPYTPEELRKDWKGKYGASTRLEFYWGDDTFTILPDEGEILDCLFAVKDFTADPCELVDTDYDDDDGDRRYGWRYG